MNSPVKPVAIYGILLLGIVLLLSVYGFEIPIALVAKPCVFILLLFLLSAYGLGLVERHSADKVGFAFMASFLLKMSLTIIFLLIVLPEEGDYRKPIALISVSYYFVLLLFQAGLLYRRLMR